MNQGNDRSAATGLLNDLDDIRSLLDESLPDDAIPVLEDAVEGTAPRGADDLDAAPAAPEAPAEPAAARVAREAMEPPLAPAELRRIPLLDDAIPDRADDEPDAFADADLPGLDDEFADWLVEPDALTEPRAAPAAFPPGATVAELLATQELQTAVRNRIDETFERWVDETLQQELTLLRARLLEVVRAEVHEYVAAQINRANATGKPHREPHGE